MQLIWTVSFFYSKLLCLGTWYEEARKQMRSGPLKEWRVSLGQEHEPCTAVGRWDGIAVLQKPWFRISKANGQTWLSCLSPCPLTVLFYRTECILKQDRMRQVQSEADAPNFLGGSWISFYLYFKTFCMNWWYISRLIYFIFLCWLSSRGDSFHLCAESFVDTERDVQMLAWSLMIEDQIYQKIYTFSQLPV